jgi:hypothetical protein
MTNADETSAGDRLWADARAHYEDRARSIDALARELNLTRFQLVREARLRGWKLRTAAKAAGTRATVQRLKELLQKRLAELEANLSKIGAEAGEASSEREIRATNLLVRTLEKVLQLERRERDTRARKRRSRIRFDDAERLELARRIEGLRIQEDRESPRRQPDAGAGNQAPDGVGAMGEAEPASAGQ